MTVVDEARLAQLEAAEETCYSLIVAISLDALSGVDVEWRKYIADGGLTRWTKLALPEPRDLPRRPRWSSSRSR